MFCLSPDVDAPPNGAQGSRITERFVFYGGRALDAGASLTTEVLEGKVRGGAYESFTA